MRTPHGIGPSAVLMICLLLGLSIGGGTAGAADGPMVLNTSYSPPYSTPEEDGILDRVLKEAFARRGVKVTLQMLPAERCLIDSNAGISDGEVGRVVGMERLYPNLVMVDEPIIESRAFVAFTNGIRFETKTWDSLAPFTVGMVKGWKIFENNVVQARSVIKVESTRALFRLLKNDRVDVALNARLDGLYMAKQFSMANVRVMEPPFAVLELYLYLHNKNADLVPGLEAALAEMKRDGAFYRIYAVAADELTTE